MPSRVIQGERRILFQPEDDDLKHALVKAYQLAGGVAGDGGV